MMGMTPIKDASRAADYFGRTDGGYYLDGRELRRQWIGSSRERLGLTGPPTVEQFERLLRGCDPHTGKQLTAMLVDDRIPGWDFTASLPKGVTTALEGGDRRIAAAFWEAGNEAMADVERHAMTRVRKGGRDDDRVTGNIVALAAEHPDTRPTKADGMPDWDRHIHFVVANVTWDDAEGKWKALKVHDIFKLRKLFSHQFDLRMSGKLAELGYEIETKLKPGRDGGMAYHTWDIKAASGHEAGWKSINDKNSRRNQEINAEERRIRRWHQG